MKKWISRVIQKFMYAIIGIWITIKEERSLLSHLIISVIVIGLGVSVRLSLNRWAILILTISIVIGFEVINTSVEALVDMISFRYNLKVKKVKDIAAGATLVVSIAAFAIGLIIFIPELIELKEGIKKGIWQ
ncbi:MAG: diacylglycerol kinase family protein [Mycoplasma sp.]|nr:diacylglycerol kinase family protein [Mycoplasma sp.]